MYIYNISTGYNLINHTSILYKLNAFEIRLKIISHIVKRSFDVRQQETFSLCARLYKITTADSYIFAQP